MNQNATTTVAVDPSTPTLVVRRVTHKVGRGERIERMPVLITSAAEASAFVARLNEQRKTTEYVIDTTKVFASVDEYDAQSAAAVEDEAKSSVAKVANRLTVADIAALEAANMIAPEKAAELRAMLKPKTAKSETKSVTAQSQATPTAVANVPARHTDAPKMVLDASELDDDDTIDTDEDEELDLSDVDAEELANANNG